MKRQEITRIIGMGMILASFFTGCASFSPERVAQGKYFIAYRGDYDPSKPIEEQCILINLADEGLFISKIDHKKARNNFGAENAPATSIVNNCLTILQPGNHHVSFYYGRSSTAGIYYEGNTGGNYTFESGQIYVVTGGERGNRISVSIANLTNYEKVPVYGSTTFTRELVPVASVIEGVNSAIKAGLQK